MPVPQETVSCNIGVVLRGVARASLRTGEKGKRVCVCVCVKKGGGYEDERTLCVTNKWKVAKKSRGPTSVVTEAPL